ncbi:HalX domain-containing protein [Haloarcula nitratireducens]|nr:HalX domain-containing protein [Halomicroarcula nitratireducens]
MYRNKPLSTAEELHDLITLLQRRGRYEPDMQQLLALASKKSTIEQYVPSSKLDSSEDYAKLADELNTLYSNLTAAEEVLVNEGFHISF